MSDLAPVPGDRPVLLAVCRSGGGYDPTWVYALRRALHRVAPDFRFVCLTDFPAVTPALGGRPLRDPKLAGYWSLVNWFAPGQFEGRVVAVGLDTLLVGDLGDLARYNGPPAGIRDFYRRDVLASGVMTWQGDELAHVWDAFHTRGARDVLRQYRRMDPWLRTVVGPVAYLQDALPGQIASFKAHCDTRGHPADARIVCFHGRPAITDLRATHWARKEWERP